MRSHLTVLRFDHLSRVDGLTSQLPEVTAERRMIASRLLRSSARVGELGISLRSGSKLGACQAVHGVVEGPVLHLLQSLRVPCHGSLWLVRRHLD